MNDADVVLLTFLASQSQRVFVISYVQVMLYLRASNVSRLVGYAVSSFLSIGGIHDVSLRAQGIYRCARVSSAFVPNRFYCFVGFTFVFRCPIIIMSVSRCRQFVIYFGVFSSYLVYSRVRQDSFRAPSLAYQGKYYVYQYGSVHVRPWYVVRGVSTLVSIRIGMAIVYRVSSHVLVQLYFMIGRRDVLFVREVNRFRGGYSQVSLVPVQTIRLGYCVDVVYIYGLPRSSIVRVGSTIWIVLSIVLYRVVFYSVSLGRYSNSAVYIASSEYSRYVSGSIFVSNYVVVSGYRFCQVIVLVQGGCTYRYYSRIECASLRSYFIFRGMWYYLYSL